MIDFTSARTAMVDCQVRPSDVTRYPIIAAMLDVPRERFVPRELAEVAYAETHIALDTGRVVLDPRTFSKMLETVNITPADLVLDIGAGLGYSTAVMSRLGEAVVGVEDDKERARDAESALRDFAADNAIVTTAPLNVGDPANGPFDVIMVEGGVEQIPEPLANQLKEGGRIAAIFMTGSFGHVRFGQKTRDRIVWRRAFDAAAPILPGFAAPAAFQL
ncbi:MAG: protein-L-isoaspartate O-methyltransferase [Pseudomonadota bacterium]